MASGCLISTMANKAVPVGIMALPPEMLQGIFNFLDALSLEKCSGVCKDWRHNADKLKSVIGESKFWCTRCHKEINSSDVQDLLLNMYPSFWIDRESINWKEVYKSWHISKVIMNNQSTSYQLLSDLNGISCIRISGEWVLISTNERESRLVAKHLWLPKEVELYVSGHEILNLELVSCEPLYIFNVVPSDELDDVFDSLGHTEIWLEFRDYCLQLGRTYRNRVEHNTVKFYGGYRVTLEQNPHYSTPVFNKISMNIRGPTVFKTDAAHFNNINYNKVVDFWSDKFTVGLSEPRQDSVHLQTFSFNRDQQELIPLNTIQLTKPVNTSPYIYSWHSSLFVSHANDPCDDLLTFAVNGNVLTEQYQLSQGRVTSALFYNSHLFLGCSTGTLLIYKLNNPKDLLSVKVHKTPAVKIKVATSSVTHIAVAESVHHKMQKPWIICATSTTVFVVRYD